MSYIPRPPASGDGRLAVLGRADELRSSSSIHSSNSAGIQSLFGRLPSTPDKAGSIKLPSSTRASIVKVMSSDSPLPGLPPIPVIDPSAASVISASAGAGSQTANVHRRTASAGDARHASPKSAPDTLDLATDNPPRPKTRLGLSSLRLVWPHGKSRQTKTAADTAQGRSRWTVEEVNALAKASLCFWKSGRPADLSALSTELDRPSREITEMLEHMLEGYARFGGVSSWDAYSPKFIMRWAAVEFPANPVLNLHSDNSRPTQGMSRLDTCLSALSCRPRSASKDLAYALESPVITASGQNVVADFREGMRMRNADYFSLGQTLSNTNPTTPERAHAAQDEPQIPPLPAVPVTAAEPRVESSSASPSAKIPSKSDTHTRNRSQSSASALQPQRNGSTKSASIRTNTVSTTEANSRPVFTGGLRNRQTVNTMSRESRARRTRNGPLKLEDVHTAVANNSSSGGPASATVSGAFTFSSAVAPVDAVSLSGVGAVVTAASISQIDGRPRSSTVAVPQSNMLASRASRDSGNVEPQTPSIPVVAMLEGLELSPEPLRQMIEVRQPDGELDTQFADLSGETRQKVRHFVARFIREYPADFQQRVEALKAGKSGLCITIDHYEHFEYDNDAFMKAIETIYRYSGGSLMYTCNMFFHIQLLHAVQQDSIPVTDDSWLRVNEFATQVFNQKIKGEQFVVLQEYRDSVVEPEPVANSRNASSWTSEARGRFSSLVSGEGDEHRSPFDRAFYLDQMARAHLKFFLENNGDEILQRAHSNGPRPMPVALKVDESTMLDFDVKVRNLLIGFIWEDIPHSRLESKEVALLRTLELLNCEIADQCGFHQTNLPRIMSNQNEDGADGEDRDITDPAAIKELPNGQLAQVVGRAFARSYFNQIKVAYLEAMIHDHPFRPVSRDDVKEWIKRGGSPFGEDVDYLLNSNLYRYLRHLNLRPSSRQWLQTSAAATLSMMRRTMNATTHPKCIAHIDIAAYEARFNEIVLVARGDSGSSTPRASIPLAVTTNGADSKPSAFDEVPVWVAMVTDSRSSTTRPAQTNGVAKHDSDRQLTESQGDTDSQSFQEIQQAQPNDTQTRESDAANSSRGSASAALRQLAYPTVNHAYNRATVLTTAPQASSSNALLVSPILHPFTVPMPSASHHLSPTPMPIPHIYSPYSPEMQPQMPMSPLVYATGGGTYGVSVPGMAGPLYHSTHSGEGADMTMVLERFEEIQRLIREMQSKKDGS